MFPLSIGTYVKAILVALVISGAWYNGYSIGNEKLTKYKLEQEAATRQKEAENQAATDQIRKEKDAQISAINTQLANALIELRNRPSRIAQSASNGQTSVGCTGATLFAEDAEFLEREASRADDIRVALDACYKQYDEVTK
jgi:hypothetical protein